MPKPCENLLKTAVDLRRFRRVWFRIVFDSFEVFLHVSVRKACQILIGAENVHLRNCLQSDARHGMPRRTRVPNASSRSYDASFMCSRPFEFYLFVSRRSALPLRVANVGLFQTLQQHHLYDLARARCTPTARRYCSEAGNHACAVLEARDCTVCKPACCATSY